MRPRAYTGRPGGVTAANSPSPGANKGKAQTSSSRALPQVSSLSCASGVAPPEEPCWRNAECYIYDGTAPWKTQ